MSNITPIQALIAKLEIETSTLLANNNLSEEWENDILEISEMFLRLTGKKSILEKIEAQKEVILNEKAQDLAFGEKFKIGLREFEKVEAFGVSKLDPVRLSEVIKDQDQYKEFFKEVPKTQAEVEKLLRQFGFDGDLEQFYLKESKGTFKIKPKN